MAKTGDRFPMVDGSVYAVTRAADETNGEFVEMEFVLPPGSVPPPPHVHPQQVEEYEILEGRLDVMVDGAWRTLEPGDTASVPRGVLHTFKNRSGEVVRVRNWHRPAVRFEDYIETIHDTLARAGVTSRRDPRILLYLSMIMADFDDTLAPGRARERIPIAAFARVGRLLRLGRRADEAAAPRRPDVRGPDARGTHDHAGEEVRMRDEPEGQLDTPDARAGGSPVEAGETDTETERERLQEGEERGTSAGAFEPDATSAGAEPPPR